MSSEIKPWSLSHSARNFRSSLMCRNTIVVGENEVLSHTDYLERSHQIRNELAKHPRCHRLLGSGTGSQPHPKNKKKRVYGAVHLVTAKLEQWLCCTATRQIARWRHLFCWMTVFPLKMVRYPLLLVNYGWKNIFERVLDPPASSMNMIMRIVVPPQCRCFTLTGR